MNSLINPTTAIKSGILANKLTKGVSTDNLKQDLSSATDIIKKGANEKFGSFKADLMKKKSDLMKKFDEKTESVTKGISTVKNSSTSQKMYGAISIISIFLAIVLSGIGQSIKDRQKQLNNDTVGGRAGYMRGGMSNQDIYMTHEEIKNHLREINQYQQTQFGGSTDNEREKQYTNEDPAVEALVQALYSIINFVKRNSNNGAIMISKQLFKATSGLISQALSTIIPTELIDKPYSELDPELANKINTLTHNLKIISEDPKSKESLQNLVKISAGISIDIIENIRPDIEEVVDKLWDTASVIGAKSAKGVVNTTVGTLMTAVSTIPILGTAVSALINSEKGVKTLLDISTKGMSSIQALMGNMENLAIKSRQLVDCNKGKVQEAKQAFKALSSQAGGYSVKRRRKTRAKGRKIENRIRKSLRKYFHSG